ncbi:MAG: AAA family ATPase [Rhodomicrobium sp.]
MTKAQSISSGVAGEGPAGPSVRVFVHNREAEAVIRHSLSTLDVNDAVFTPANLKAAAAALAKESSPDLLVLDISGVDDALEGLRAVAEACDPSVTVIAIGDRNDIGFYRELKNAGINDYFTLPVQREPFAGACKAILAPEGSYSDRKTGQLVYVLGVRGGVGATTLATCLAWSLAETARRHTVLVDLGLQSGDAALQLDTVPDRALFDALGHPERLDKLLLERGLKRITDRLSLFASLEPLDAEAAVSEESFLWLLSNLLPRYRFTIVDVPPSLAMKITWALRIPSTCLLVSNPSLSGARDLARWSEIVGPDTPERHTVHIVNHVAPHGGLAGQDFAQAFGKPAEVVVPYSREIAEATPLGIQAMNKCRAFQKSLAPIRRNFTGEAQERADSLLGRLLGGGGKNTARRPSQMPAPQEALR